MQVAAEFLGKFYKGAVVFLPNPTWGNHKKIFPNGGVAFKEYRYYNNSRRAVDIEVNSLVIPTHRSCREASIFAQHA
eukprot:6278316-Pyramimonas_sp.AAC.1